jgi:hypothetical protein
VGKRQWKGGDIIYLAAGDTWTEPLLLEGEGASCAGSHMRGDFERIDVNPTNISVYGWVVDPLLANNGTPPVKVRVSIDGTPVLDTVADVPRGDLVDAGVAPNPQHGLGVTLPAAAFATLQHGTHHVSLMASNAAPQCGDFSWALPGPILSKKCVCDGALCDCPASTEPPLQIRGSASEGEARPTIRLNGTGMGISALGFGSVSITGIEVTDATEGIVAVGAAGGTGTAEVTDCVFRGVWNRSSIGQTKAQKGRDCTSGWSTTVSLGDYGNATVTRCLFDEIDTAFQPRGALGTMSFTRNTMTRANGNTVPMVGHTEWSIEKNVFSRDTAPRFFMCGTTDIMIGGLGTVGVISNNEIGWRGEHPASPDGSLKTFVISIEMCGQIPPVLAIPMLCWQMFGDI